MFIRLRKSYDRPKAKVYYSVGIMLLQLRFMSRQKTLNTESDGYSSSNKLLPSYTDTFKESSPNKLPEVLVSFDPHKYNPSELLKRFRARRSCDRSYKRQSSALLVKSVIKEKSYKETANIE
jgi:hypothetical protein